MKNFYLPLFFLLFTSNLLFSQGSIPLNYKNPSEYAISKVVVLGTKTLDEEAIISLSGFKTGDVISIPGEKISQAIRERSQLYT